MHPIIQIKVVPTTIAPPMMPPIMAYTVMTAVEKIKNIYVKTCVM